MADEPNANDRDFGNWLPATLVISKRLLPAADPGRFAITVNDHVVIPLYHSTDFSLVKPYVDGLTITPLGILNLTGVSLRR